MLNPQKIEVRLLYELGLLTDKTVHLESRLNKILLAALELGIFHGTTEALSQTVEVTKSLRFQGVQSMLTWLIPAVQFIKVDGCLVCIVNDAESAKHNFITARKESKDLMGFWLTKYKEFKKSQKKNTVNLPTRVQKAGYLKGLATLAKKYPAFAGITNMVIDQVKNMDC